MEDKPAEERYHLMSVEETYNALGSKKDGISNDEAKMRLEKFGLNEIEETAKTSLLALFLSQFKSFLVIILLVAVIISFVSSLFFGGEILESIAILAIVFANSILGFVQEYRAEKAIEALKQIAAPEAVVFRNDTGMRIPSRELVPGDIVLLEMGNRVPADVRLIEAVNLKIDEASLTGESVPVQKFVQPLEKDALLADRKNMAYSGTTVAYGRGKAIVTATGMTTELGKIAQLIQTTEDELTPLQKRLDVVGRWLGVGCIIAAAIVALTGIFRAPSITQPFLVELFLWSVSIAVAGVPEALPAVVVIALTVGVQRMAKRNSIVRRLPVVETLGSTSVICTDKTGTLTKNEMTVSKLYTNSKMIDVTGSGYSPNGEFLLQGTSIDPIRDNNLKLLLQVGALCNDAHLQTKTSAKENNPSTDEVELFGDPTEGALIVAAAKAGIVHDELKEENPRIWEIPFTSESKFMATVHATDHRKNHGTLFVGVKGAPEKLLNLCKNILENDKIIPLTDEKREEINNVNLDMGAHALRVLGMAYREIPDDHVDFNEDAVLQDLVFVGLQGMIDPPREEVIRAVEKTKTACIRTVMITGDQKLTAKTIAKEIGILEEGDLVLTGQELEQMNDKEFNEIVDKVSVYARVSPENKNKIVNAWREKGHITAMTGDGINDAPALKRADIGIAMGITGTDVAKEASDMILTDDNFATIVAAVEEGRGIFDNIKKYLSYLLRGNVGEIVLLFITSLIGLPLPLIAIQILWINLVTDGFPAVALGVDPMEPDILERPPRDPKSGVFDTRIRFFIIGMATLMVTTTLPLYWWMINTGVSVDHARTMIFSLVVAFELWSAFAARSEKYSLFEIGPFANRWLVIAVVSSIALQLAVVYVPFLQPVFNTVSLSLMDWGIIILLSSSALISVEIVKFLRPYEQFICEAPS
ncbi:MAG: calcium-translocating P-type ATPase, SERCA-type [Promethearchaeota archaeon]